MPQGTFRRHPSGWLRGTCPIVHVGEVVGTGHEQCVNVCAQLLRHCRKLIVVVHLALRPLLQIPQRLQRKAEMCEQHGDLIYDGACMLSHSSGPTWQATSAAIHSVLASVVEEVTSEEGRSIVAGGKC